MLVNLRPRMTKRVPWPWKNHFSSDGFPYVVENPGYIAMPENFNSYFDWDHLDARPMWEYPLNLHGNASTDHKSFFSTASRFLGMDNLILEWPPLDEILYTYLQWNIELLKALDKRKIPLTYMIVGDDISSPDGICMDPRRWRLYLKPVYEEFINSLLGVGYEGLFIYQSKGNIAEIVEDLYRIGFAKVHAQDIVRSDVLKSPSEPSFGHPYIIEENPDE